MRTQSSFGLKVILGLAFLLPIVALAGCGSNGPSATETQAANDPQKAAAAGQAGAAASAANQQARQADEARRAAQKR